MEINEAEYQWNKGENQWNSNLVLWNINKNEKTLARLIRKKKKIQIIKIKNDLTEMKSFIREY